MAAAFMAKRAGLPVHRIAKMESLELFFIKQLVKKMQ